MSESEGAAGVAGDVKEAFKGKRGKVLLAGGVLFVAYLWYRNRNGATAPGDLLDTEAPGRVAPDPTPDPAGGGGSGGGTLPTGRPTTNAQWLSQGVDYLVSQNASAAYAYDALRKALDGLPLDTAQIALVSLVLLHLGAPPEGMPPLGAAPPTPPSGGNPTPTPPPPAPTPPPAPAEPQYLPVVVTRWTATNPDKFSTLWGIARYYGRSESVIWNDPKNAALKARTGNNPKLIRPGDVIYIRL